MGYLTSLGRSAERGDSWREEKASRPLSGVRGEDEAGRLPSSLPVCGPFLSVCLHEICLAPSALGHVAALEDTILGLCESQCV